MIGVSGSSLARIHQSRVRTLTPVVDGDIHTAITRGSSTTPKDCSYATRNCAVLLVSNLKGVVSATDTICEPEPALGAVWSSVANIRLMMTRISDNTVEVCVTRGAKTGQKCYVTIDNAGITDTNS